MKLPDAPQVLARIHLPLDHPTAFLFRRFGENVGAMDGSIFAFTRAAGTLDAHARREISAPAVIGRDQMSLFSITPMNPEFWDHLKPGQTLEMIDLQLSAQVVYPLMENPA